VIDALKAAAMVHRVAVLQSSKPAKKASKYNDPNVRLTIL
jgi:hypothetical protein